MNQKAQIQTSQTPPLKTLMLTRKRAKIKALLQGIGFKVCAGAITHQDGRIFNVPCLVKRG